MQINTSWGPYRFSIIINLSLTHLYWVFSYVLFYLILLSFFHLYCYSPVLFSPVPCHPRAPPPRPPCNGRTGTGFPPSGSPSGTGSGGQVPVNQCTWSYFCSELLCKPSLWQILILGVITGIFVHVRNIRTCKYHVLVMVNTTLSIP